MILKNKERQIWLLILLILFFVYYLLLPNFLQGGDSAELVLSGQLFLVPHPPGYPLLNWINGIGLNIFNFQNSFFTISFINLIISFITIFFIYKRFLNNWFIFLFLVNFLFTENFLQNSLIPEVFALHILIITFIIAYSNSNSFKWFVPFFYIIGFSHHLTTILFTPFLILYFFNFGLKKNLKPIVSGLFFFLLLYLSIFFLHPNHPFSWGNIQSIFDIRNHFLRTDYGLLRFSASSESAIFNLDPIIYYAKNIFHQNIFLFFLLIMIIWKTRKELFTQLNFAFFTTFILNLIFLSMTNFEIIEMGKDVIFRFFIIPNFLVFIYVLIHISKIKQNIFLTSGLVIHLGWLIFSNAPIRHLPNDNLIEQYAKDFIKYSKEAKTSNLILDSDPGFFSVRYLIANNFKEKEYKVISPTMLNLKWFQIKTFENFYPDEFKLENILFNEPENKSYFVDKNFQDIHQYHLTYFPLGRKIEKGRGVSFAPESISKFNQTSHLQKETKMYLLNEYCSYFLAKGLDEFQKNNFNEAEKNFQKALEINPSNIFARNNLKELQKRNHL